MRTTRTALTLGLVLLPVAAMATPAFMKPFADTYKVKPGTPLAGAKCLACHVGGPKLNPYGQDMAKAMKAMKTKALTPAVLKKIQTLDSDKDGVKNVAEIKKGTLPGDPKSK